MALKGPPLTADFLYSIPDGTILWMAFTGASLAHEYELMRISLDGKNYKVRNVKTNRILELQKVGTEKNCTRFWLENPDDNLPITWEQLCEMPGNEIVWVRFGGWSKSAAWYTDIYECEEETELTFVNNKKEKVTIKKEQVGNELKDIRVYRKEPGK